ncbi:MAG: anaerobic ribonucleoside-triphosphate reductase [bacterium]|nr:anaerobic ribonucleoside-triphosphate reductase [bacterium]
MFPQDQEQLLQEYNSLRTKCEVWTRVMGYHRPVSQFNRGKQSEHFERQHFSEVVSCESSYACAA